MSSLVVVARHAMTHEQYSFILRSYQSLMTGSATVTIHLFLVRVWPWCEYNNFIISHDSCSTPPPPTAAWTRHQTALRYWSLFSFWPENNLAEGATLYVRCPRRGTCFLFLSPATSRYRSTYEWLAPSLFTPNDLLDSASRIGHRWEMCIQLRLYLPPPPPGKTPFR
jgi:hypothetical protein